MKYFGTDGIRGRAGVGILRAERLVLLARALGTVLARHGMGSCLIARDTRPSGPMIETALATGLTAVGLDVHLAGVLTTPGAFAVCRELGIDATVVVSASHNPAVDNGIKVILPNGEKPKTQWEEEVESLYDLGDFPDRSGEGIGSVFPVPDGVEVYVRTLLENLPTGFSLDGVRLVLDCANGAAHLSAPEVFRRLGADVVPLFCDPMGEINLSCGALHPRRVADAVVEHGAHLGVALDGDGDRLFASDELGNVVDGDQILALLARHRRAADLLPGDTVVATVMSNAGLDISLADAGIELHRTDVGDRNVSQAMAENGWGLGGEQSGHIIFALDSRPAPGDGTSTALALLQAILAHGRPLSEFLSCITLLPQALMNVPVKEKVPFESMPDVVEAKGRVEKALAGRGRVFLRYSGTEKLARVLVEGDDEKAVQAHARDLVRALEEAR